MDRLAQRLAQNFIWETSLPDLFSSNKHSYFLKPTATKFQTAVNAKKLNHHPVAGKITPRTIACSATPAIKYCFKVIFYPFCKAFCLTEYI